ncbi:hypothetical protein VKT23_012568 [Stygiomarasmius scandens]|uniref:Uncharacterized protein n=1 Tax=Marasmiellus scandens TaxID=2682957 RepID=A0ABR1J864_9AGAR
MERPYTVHLQLLRNRERAWRTLVPIARHPLRLIHSGGIYEFAGGVYGNGKETGGRSKFSITLYDLPALGSGQQDRLTHSLEGLDIVDFTIDPSQDLLILVVLAPRNSEFIYNLYLRSMTTNQAHPFAAAPIFCCMRRPEHLGYIDGAVRVRISGSLVGFLIKEVVNSVGGHFEVYNWKTGGPVNGCVVRHASGIEDFIFLSQDRFLLVRPNGMFEVYSFSDPGFNPGTPVLKARFEFPALSEDYRYWYICLGSNPSPGYDPGAGNYGRNRTCYPSPAERLHACCIYVHRPESITIHSFVFFFRATIFTDLPAEWTKHTRHTTNPYVRSPVYHIPWEVWGPKNTRWFRECFSKDWQHSVYGLRTIECVTDINAVDGTHDGPEGGIREADDEDSDTDEDNMGMQNSAEQISSGIRNAGTSDFNLSASILMPPTSNLESRTRSRRSHQPTLKHLRMRDFNPYNISRALDHWKRDVRDEGGGGDPAVWHDYSEPQGIANGKNPAWDDKYSTKRQRRIIIGKSTVEVCGVFKSNIVSQLPYVEVVTEREYDTTEVMMDDCRLLLLKGSKREIEIHECVQPA